MNMDSNTIHFFGRLHPLVLHLPIGLVIGAFMLEVAGVIFRLRVRQAVLWLLALGVLSGVLTAVFGLLLSREGGYDQTLLNWHQWLGLSLPVAICFCWTLKWVECERQGADQWAVRIAYGVLLCGTVVLTGWVGHLGGSMTHGPDYITAYLPSWLTGDDAPKTPTVTVANVNRHYATTIQPILQAHCYECHNAAKAKGGLVLEDIERAKQGGKSGLSAIVPGDAMGSQLVRRITLPADHEQGMPPAGKPPLSPEDTLALIRWIDHGAQSVSDEPPPPDRAAPADAIAAVRKRGGLVVPIDQDSNWLRVDFSTALPRLSDDEMGLLDPLADHIAWLDLANTAVTDASAKWLAARHQLTRLSMQNTAISDETCCALGDLKYLRYLNLYNTQITDAGLEHLKSLDKLRRLYLWQTKVSDEAVATMAESMPKLTIERGQSQPAESPKEPAAPGKDQPADRQPPPKDQSKPRPKT